LTPAVKFVLNLNRLVSSGITMKLYYFSRFLERECPAFGFGNKDLIAT